MTCPRCGVEVMKIKWFGSTESFAHHLWHVCTSRKCICEKYDTIGTDAHADYRHVKTCEAVQIAMAQSLMEA